MKMRMMLAMGGVGRISDRINKINRIKKERYNRIKEQGLLVPECQC